MFRFPRTFALLTAALLGLAAHADRYFVEGTRGSNVPEGDRETVTELVRLGVSEGGRNSVAKDENDAQWTLSPTLMRLGDAYVLSLQKKNKAGQTVYSEKMKATTMSEMDMVASRLTRAVMSGTSFGETADITNVTKEEETMHTRRVNATRQWAFGLGPGWTSNLRSSGGGFTFLLGFLWGIDPDFSINLSWTINSGRKDDDASFSELSLGGEYYFTRSKHAPFVGARLGYGSARVNHDNCNILQIGCTEDRASGWAGTLNAGYKFFRTSTVNAAVIGGYSQIFDRTSLGSPGLTTLQIAVYF